MRNTIITVIILATALSISVAGLSHADDPKAREIMQRVEDREDGKSGTSDMEMLLIDRHGKERVRSIRSFFKDFGEDTYRIMFFTSPADVKDTSFLTYDYDNASKDDDQWLYLPALGKTKRIATSDKSGSFMGSDFNYSDMTRRELEDYDFKLLKEDNVADKKVWLIESLPRDQKTIDETGYKKSVVFVRQDNYVVVRAVHWLETGNKLRYMDVQQLDLIDGIWVATEIHMTTKQGKATEHKTVLRFRNLKLNIPLDDEMFTVRRMEKGL